MINYDIFLRKKVKQIDVFLNELTLNTEIKVCEKLVLKSILTNMFVIAYAVSKNNNCQLDVEVGNIFGNCFALAKSNFLLDLSLYNSLLQKYISADSNILKIYPSELDVSLDSFAVGNNATFNLSIDTKNELDIVKYAEICNNLGLDIFSEFTQMLVKKFIYSSNNFKIIPTCNEILEIYYSLENRLQFETSLDGIYLATYRKFSDLEGLTINDIVNMNIEDFTLIKK